MLHLNINEVFIFDWSCFILVIILTFSKENKIK
jgi:hypothetical protein